MKKLFATLMLLMLCLSALLPCAAEEPTRTLATEYAFTASPDAVTEIHDLIFDGNVAVSGVGQAVYFYNCEFRGNIVNTAAEQTFVWIMPDCSLNEGCHCIIANGVKEADIDYAIPKFALFFPVEVECDCLGGVIAMGTFDIVLGGVTYTAEDVEIYQTAAGEMIPYEAGKPVAAHVAIRWWENGEQVFFKMGVEPEA